MSVRLLPLARAVRWTRLARQQLFADAGSASLPLVLFAASFNFNKVLHEMRASAGFVAATCKRDRQ